MTKFNCALIGLALLFAMTGVTILVCTYERKGKIMKVLAIIFLAALATGAHAQQTWDYTGAAMTGTSSGLYVGDAPTSIAGDVVLANALNPNAVNQVVTPVAYAFTGLPMLSSSMFQSGLLPAPVFEFSTQNGAVTSWEVALYGSGGAYTDTLTITAKGDSFQSLEYNGMCAAEHNCGIYNAVNTTAGAWVDPPSTKISARAPELSSNGLASGLVLLLGGIAVLSSRRA